MSHESITEILDNNPGKKQEDSQGHTLGDNETNKDLTATGINIEVYNEIPSDNKCENSSDISRIGIKFGESINNNDQIIQIEETALAKEVNQLNITDENKANHEAEQNNKFTVQVNKQTTSLKNILVYNTDDDSTEDEFDADWQLQAIHSPDSSSSSEEESSGSDIEEITSPTIHGENTGAIKKKDSTNNKNSTTKGTSEIGFDELPPVPDLSTLSLDVSKDDFIHMGHIHSIIDRLVTVESLPNIPAYDLDTLLFFGVDKKILGNVYDVMGQVTSPIYAIRFNSAKDIINIQVEKGMKVFSAPKSKYTQYVFVKELMKIRGSDASWKEDSEVPAEFEEFSDDETEHLTRTGRPFNLQRPQKRPHSSSERHKRFERTMNHCNTINTRVYRLLDAHNNIRGNVIRPDSLVQHQMNELQNLVELRRAAAVAFDPAVPPPGYGDMSRVYFYAGDMPGVSVQGQREGENSPSFLNNMRFSQMMGPPPAARRSMQNYYTNSSGRSQYPPGPSYGYP